MDKMQDLESLVIEQFSKAQNYGFSEPIVKRRNYNTAIDWFHEGIALEAELDWREYTIFVLIVRLEDGKLPAGYYVSNGRQCRLHLQEAIRNRGWTVDQGALKQISAGPKKKSRNFTAAGFQDRVEGYRKVLMSCIEQLVAERNLIFQ
jgi:hypothetical protein